MAGRKPVKKKKDTTSKRFYTQEGAMSRPSGEDDTEAHVLTAREIAEKRKKLKASKKGK